MLYPQTNKHRTVLSLNGLWKFQLVSSDFIPKQPLKSFDWIGVPASYNDLFTERKYVDHVGLVCYEREITFPQTSAGDRWTLRIGAAGNRASVYLDGILQTKHNGGFLPIDCPLQESSGTHRLSIVLDNRLDYETLPVGEYQNGTQVIHYDFRNFTGLHRDVLLYRKPKTSIEDIVITTSVKEDVATVQYTVTCKEVCDVVIQNPKGLVVGVATGNTGEIEITKPMLWDIGQGHLYTLTATTKQDQYTESFGIRSIEVTKDAFLLNGKPVHFRGFGMHEDHDIVGKGSFSALNVREFELLKWTGANSFRTSHYPYAEEMYELADKLGILIINEIPAVGLNFWSSRTVFQAGVLDHRLQDVYKTQFDELIARDKNHPSIVMYSLANEANTHEAGALEFFSELFAHARTKTTLPLMIVEWVGAKDNKVAPLADVIGLNRYLGWYVDFANLSNVKQNLTTTFQEYRDKYNKPLFLTEFGADTIAGLHKLPSVAFSEEFQVEFISTYLDTISELDYVIGEHVWNLADFDTKQGLTRVDGNKKGVFTRQRQPKMVAHFLRQYWKR